LPDFFRKTKFIQFSCLWNRGQCYSSIFWRLLKWNLLF
jgi:hypothetical protein